MRKNLRLAGVLKNKSRTSKVVPFGCAAGLTVAAISRPSTSTCQACSASPSAGVVADVMVKRDTELIEANASPRKPKL